MSNALTVSLVLKALDEASPVVNRLNEATARLGREGERDGQAQVRRLDRVAAARKRVKIITLDQSRAEQAAAATSEKTLQKEEKSQARRAALAAKREGQFQKAGQLRGELMGLVMGGAAVALPVKLSISWESSWADVNKVADFTEAESAKYQAATLALSTRIPMAATGLAAIMESGAQSGIAKDELLGFAEAAAKMGVAFGVSGDEAGSTMAAWRSGLGLSHDRVIRLADAVNHLSNNMNATAPDISNILQRIGPFAQTAGLAEEKTAALAAAFLAPGTSAEKAATGIQNFLLALGGGEGMKDSQVNLWSKMGFDPKQMAKDMQKDAPALMKRVLMAIRKQRADLQPAIIEELFGREGMMAISPLIANIEQFDNAMSMVGKDDAFAGSMEKEYQTRAATTENSLILLKNQLARMAITMGSSVLPMVNDMVKGLSGLADRAAQLASDFPGVTKAVMAAAMGMVALKAGMLAVKMVSNTVGGAITSVQWAASFLSRDSQAAAKSTKALATATNQAGTAAGAAGAAGKVGKLVGAVGKVMAWAGPVGLVVSLGLSFLDLGSAAERAAEAQQIHAQIQGGLTAEIEKAGGSIAQLAAGYDKLSDSARAAKAYQLEQQVDEQKGAVKTSRNSIHSLWNQAFNNSHSGGKKEDIARWDTLMKGAGRAKEAGSSEELRTIFSELLVTAKGDKDAEAWVRQLASIIEGKEGENGLAAMLEQQEKLEALLAKAAGKELTPVQQQVIGATPEGPVGPTQNGPPLSMVTPTNTDAQRAGMAALAARAVDQAKAAQADWPEADPQEQPLPIPMAKPDQQRAGMVALLGQAIEQAKAAQGVPTETPRPAPTPIIQPPAITITANGIGADELVVLLKSEIDKAMAVANAKLAASAKSNLHDG